MTAVRRVPFPRRARRAAIVAALTALCATAPRAQAPAPESAAALRILSPGPDSYVSGASTLLAEPVPPLRVRDIARLQFFADGRVVCAVDAPRRLECPWDAGVGLRAHVVRAVAELHGGGRVTASVRTRALDVAERAVVEVVQVTAVVADRGRFVKGLPVSAFRVLEDGVPQRVTHFSPEGSPLEIVVALDVSGSMADAMPQLKAAVRRFLERLGPKDQATLVAFNDAMFTLARRETAPAARVRAVDRLAPWGGTALYDVIIRALGLVSAQPGRRVLVVFTDGDDQSSHASLAAVEEAVRGSDTTLFMIGLGRGTQIEDLRRNIERLADLSGGRTLFVDRVERLDEPFSEILEELSNQYLLGFESTNPARNGAWRALAVDVPGTGYSVRARQGYRAAKAGS